MRTLIKNIKELLQIRNNEIKLIRGREMKILPTLKNAYLIIENAFISDFGPMDDLKDQKFDLEIDAKGKLVLPSWCDSHTHIVYGFELECQCRGPNKNPGQESLAKAQQQAARQAAIGRKPKRATGAKYLINPNKGK